MPDKFTKTFRHASFGTHSAHELASDGYSDYYQALSILMSCEEGDRIEDEFGEEWVCARCKL